MRLAAPLLVLALLLAGCAVPGAREAPPAAGSLPREVVTIAENFPLPMADGTIIDVWVFRPDVAEPVPIIINYSPYWSNLAPPASTGGDAYSLHLIDRYLPRGYAIALVSVRGTGLSEGCFSIGGPQEIDDADAILTHLATLPWANGKAAAVAKSYDGTVAQALVARANPHLATIVPVSPISEWYKYNHYGGVTYAGSEQFNTFYEDLVSWRQSDDPRNDTYSRTPTRFCDESADVQASQYHSVVTGDYSAYWRERNYTAMLPERVTTSVFYVHGLQDWNVKPDHMTPWIDELRARGATVKMWLGQWGHDYPHRGDWNETFLRWVDQELKGIPTGIRDDPLVQVQDTAGMWRDEPEWPPARSTGVRYHPSADGTFALAPGSGASAYRDAPLGILAGTPAEVLLRFESEPIAEGMRIAGSPVFSARVSATGPRATLAVALLVDGVVVDQGFLDLAHRDGLETSAPMTPGQAYDVSLPLYPQDVVVPRGARLGLVVGAHAPDGAPVEILPVSAGGLVTLAHGEATSLWLPTLALDDVRPEAPQPENVGCWSC